MITKGLISFDISILIIRYGKSAVLRELSDQLGLSESDLEMKLHIIHQKKHVEKKKKAAEFSLENQLTSDPEKDKALRKLKARFDNRTFLPELRDIKRLLDRRGISSRTLKSRATSQKILFSALAKEDIKSLTRLLEEPTSNGSFSSLGIISEEILKNKKS